MYVQSFSHALRTPNNQSFNDWSPPCGHVKNEVYKWWNQSYIKTKSNFKKKSTVEKYLLEKLKRKQETEPVGNTYWHRTVTVEM